MRRAYQNIGIAALLGSALAALPAAAQQQRAVETASLPATSASAVFAVEQLDAMLAPIALYPDAVLAPLLMAASDPLQVVMAARWVAQPEHAALKEDALAAALSHEDWDPAAKALVPFPSVLHMLSDHLDWTIQLGYAVADQPDAVLDSLQRLRRQALRVSADAISGPFTVQRAGAAVVIVPASPPGIAVPATDPAVYGPWPYASVLPVHLHATAAAEAEPPAALRDLCSIAWNRNEIVLDVKRWNAVNGDRPGVTQSAWHPRPTDAITGLVDVDLGATPPPPDGPVGRPVRPSGIPANAIGRAIASVPAELVRRPAAAVVHVMMPPHPLPTMTRASLPAAAASAIHLAPLPARIETAHADALSDVAAGAQATLFQARGAESRDPLTTPPQHQQMAVLAP